MDDRQIEAFRRALLEQRDRLIREVLGAESALEEIGTARESELEEQAREDRTAQLLARLDDRGKAELEAVDAALVRLAEGHYGRCLGCGGRIARRRLAALPATAYCRECAERAERGEPEIAGEEDRPSSGPVPPDYGLLTARELEDVIYEHVAEDGRVDIDELRILCRRGVVFLEGSLPSDREREILMHLLTDVMGLIEVVDHLQVKEILWERDDRSKEDTAAETKPWEDNPGTDDVVDVHEKGEDFVPPGMPGPDKT